MIANQRAREAEAATLGELGVVFRATELPDIDVRIPRALADAAVRAWERDDVEDMGAETPAQREIRHRAGMLALIGLRISEAGRDEGANVVVRLPVEFIGAALATTEQS